MKRALLFCTVVAAVCLPHFVLAGRALRSSAPVVPMGDWAMTELGVLDATEGRQTLGAYSRFGFRHPGPALFYWAAPLYAATGRAGASITASVALWNGLLAAAILGLVWRVRGRKAAAWTALALAAYVRIAGGVVLADWWNPHTAILPMALCVTASALGSVPLALLGGSLAAQSHMGAVPVVACALLFLLSTRPRLRWWHGAFAALLWAGPLVDLLAGRRSNAAELLSFLAAARGSHPLREAAPAVLRWVPLWAAALCLPLLPRCRLARLTALLVPVCVLAAARAFGELHPYLLAWASALLLTALVAAAGCCAMAPRWAAALPVVTACALSWGTARRAVPPPYHHPEVARASARLLPVARGSVRIRVLHNEAWPYAAGVFTQLRKAGVSVSADADLAGVAGRRYTTGAAPDTLVTFCRPGYTDGATVFRAPAFTMSVHRSPAPLRPGRYTVEEFAAVAWGYDGACSPDQGGDAWSLGPVTRLAHPGCRLAVEGVPVDASVRVSQAVATGETVLRYDRPIRACRLFPGATDARPLALRLRSVIVSRPDRPR
jgi:hypothetical protein